MPPLPHLLREPNFKKKLDMILPDILHHNLNILFAALPQGINPLNERRTMQNGEIYFALH
jgi:hypothetical protein